MLTVGEKGVVNIYLRHPFLLQRMPLPLFIPLFREAARLMKRCVVTLQKLLSLAFWNTSLIAV